MNRAPSGRQKLRRLAPYCYCRQALYALCRTSDESGRVAIPGTSRAASAKHLTDADQGGSRHYATTGERWWWGCGFVTARPRSLSAHAQSQLVQPRHALAPSTGGPGRRGGLPPIRRLALSSWETAMQRGRWAPPRVERRTQWVPQRRLSERRRRRRRGAMTRGALDFLHPREAPLRERSGSARGQGASPGPTSEASPPSLRSTRGAFTAVVHQAMMTAILHGGI
jgi:hypothetical protein